MANLTKIYDLRDNTNEYNRQSIKGIQHATLHTKDFGLVPEHGLFGSDEWWAAVGNDTIPKITVEGIITDVYMSGHNDYPEFELTSEQGKTTWGGGFEAIVKGRRAKVVYIQQKFKKPLPMPGGKEKPLSEIMLELWVDVEDIEVSIGTNDLTDILEKRHTMYSLEITGLIKAIAELGGKEDLERMFNEFKSRPLSSFRTELRTMFDRFKQRSKKQGWKVH